MKTELAMSLIAKVAARGDQHGGKGKPAKTGGFDEALAAKIDARVEKRIPQDRRAERMDETRPNWRIGERLAFAMPRGEPVDDASGLRDLFQPVRDDPQTSDDMAAVALPPAEPHASETPRDVASPPRTQRSEANAAAMPAQVAAPPALSPTEPVPQAAPDEAVPASAPAVASGPAPAAPAMAAPTTAAPVAAAQTQQRPRGERGEPAEPAPTADAPADGEDSRPTPAPRGEAATVAAAAVPAEPRATPARTEPAPRERQPVAAAPEPADRTAPSAAPQPEGAARQRPAPGIAAASPETPAAERAVTPAPQAAETASGAQPRVTVLSFNAATPAPVMPVPLNPTAAGLVAAIGAEPTWRAAAAEAASAATQRGQGSISSLRIQLNPAEFGMVTARLTIAGPQLEIEIRVESNDARQRLAADGDAIVKALRAIGYDIDKVTIQQAPQGGSPAPQQGGQGRDSFLNGQGQAQERANGNAGGRNGQGNESGTGRRGTGETVAERSGGDVYI